MHQRPHRVHDRCGRWCLREEMCCEAIYLRRDFLRLDAYVFLFDAFLGA